MKRQVLHSALVFVALSFTSLQAQAYTCRPANDPISIQRRDYVIKLVTATDSATIARRILYNLPSAMAYKVTVVGSGSVCNSAGAAYHAVVKPGTPPISRTLTVIRIGTTRYVVDDPSELFGHFSSKLVFDRNWLNLSGWSN